MIDAGVTSLKIEGRMKSAYYVATVASAYRALDSHMKDPRITSSNRNGTMNCVKVSHRIHPRLYQKPSSRDRELPNSDYVREWQFIGVVLGVDEATARRYRTAAEQVPGVGDD